MKKFKPKIEDENYVIKLTEEEYSYFLGQGCLKTELMDRFFDDLENKIFVEFEELE